MHQYVFLLDPDKQLYRLLFLALVIPAAYHLSLGGDNNDKSENPFLPASASFSQKTA